MLTKLGNFNTSNGATQEVRWKTCIPAEKSRPRSCSARLFLQASSQPLMLRQRAHSGPGRLTRQVDRERACCRRVDRPSRAARAQKASKGQPFEDSRTESHVLPTTPRAYLVEAVRVGRPQRIKRRRCLCPVFPLLVSLHGLCLRLPLLHRLGPLQSVGSASGRRSARACRHGALALGIVHFSDLVVRPT